MPDHVLSTLFHLKAVYQFIMLYSHENYLHPNHEITPDKCSDSMESNGATLVNITIYGLIIYADFCGLKTQAKRAIMSNWYVIFYV